MWFIDLLGLALALIGWLVLFLWSGKADKATDGIVNAIDAIERIKEARGEKDGD